MNLTNPRNLKTYEETNESELTNIRNESEPTNINQ
jgi:hypothetical protein